MAAALATAGAHAGTIVSPAQGATVTPTTVQPGILELTFTVSLDTGETFPAVQLSTSSATNPDGSLTTNDGYCTPEVGGADFGPQPPFQAPQTMTCKVMLFPNFAVASGVFYWTFSFARDDNCTTDFGYTFCLPQQHFVGPYQIMVQNVKPAAPSLVTPAAIATAVCRDGSRSYSLHRSGTCSYHRGVASWLRHVPA
jgi:hypothetical protein